MMWNKSICVAVVMAATGGGLSAQDLKKNWRPIPANLWAQVAVVPPGTTGASQTQTVPGTTAPTDTTTTVAPPGVTPGQITTPGQPGAFPTTPPPGVPTVPAGAGTTVSNPVTVGRVPETQGRAPAATMPPDCKVTAGIAETSVASTGGPVLFAPRFSPATCATEPVSDVSWIQRKADSKAQGYAFNVEPNSTKLPRQGALRVGDVSMTVKQAAGRFAPFAAAPSRVEFSVGEKIPAKQTVTAWSEDAGIGFSAKTPTPWLKVTPVVRNGKAGAQKFTVELAPAALKPGSHQGLIEITSPGLVNDPIRIPVVVTVAGKQK